MSMLIGLSGATSASQGIYDPTGGSGSLLLKAHDEAKCQRFRENVANMAL